ncbi:MAG: SGNH/GDSL hydrolase family protein [Flavobacteriaceae bacterium]|nr:SGNH/GDSL hydrolase family protein [Flavobacteriaceae bacterium]
MQFTNQIFSLDSRRSFLLLTLCLVFLYACKKDDSFAYDISDIVENNTSNSVKVLSLGDSYTKGESVCESCGFPTQLKNELYNNINDVNIVKLEVLAQTGWTTGSLLTAIGNQNLDHNFNLVTLLIGVNNQYQGIPFSAYEEQFPQLVDLAVTKAFGNSDKVIVISIPDYAFTPFGQTIVNPALISEEIDAYNAFAENYCQTRGIRFLDITDITRLGLEQPELVATDGLHPSALAYERFVERLLPIALEKIE